MPFIYRLGMAGMQIEHPALDDFDITGWLLEEATEWGKLHPRSIAFTKAAKRITELSLALQNYMDAMRYADKESLMSAIKLADIEALKLVPRRLPQTTDTQQS